MTRLTSDELVDFLAGVDAANPVVVFAGSGVSIPSPAFVPSVGMMIGETLSAVSVRGGADLGELAQDVLPEICFENLGRILGSGVVDVWSALDFWRNDPRLVGRGIQPNSVHLALVYIAWTSRQPIVTPNYDCMFEEAAVLLGLRPVVSVPDGSAFERKDARDSNDVEIWKVHGSVDDPATVRTTIQSISQMNSNLLEALRSVLTGRARLVLIGYSGRDLDLYPWLSQFSYLKPPLWLDFKKALEAKEPEHRSWRWSGALEQAEIDGGSWPLDLANKLRGAAPAVISNAHTVAATSPSLASVRDDIKKMVRDHVVRVLRAPASRDVLLVAGAQLLSAVGNHSLALTELAKVDQSRLSAENAIQAELVASRAFTEIGRYAAAEESARVAIKAARSGRSVALQVDAVAQRDFARLQQRFPYLKFQDFRHLLRPSTWAALFAEVTGPFLNARRLRKGLISEEEGPGPWATVVEQSIRAGAILNPLLALLPRRFAFGIAEPMWSRIRERSLRIGYAAGLANAHKYAFRLGLTFPDESNLEEAEGLYGFLSHTTGAALHLRDEGDALGRSHREAKSRGEPRAVSEFLRDRAISCYEESIRIAEELGDRSIVLKNRIQLKRLDPSRLVSESDASELLSSLEGTAYRRLEKRLVGWLSSS